MIFDDSFQYTDKERRARHGMPWSEHDLNHLKRLAERRSTLKQMCVALERPASGVAPKLAQHKLIIRTPSGAYGWAEPMPHAETTTETQPETQEETTMNHEKAGERVSNICTQVLIRGRDASNMSDEEIFKLIARLEQDIDALRAIRAKSTKVANTIHSLQLDIDQLVAYVDAR